MSTILEQLKDRQFLQELAVGAKDLSGSVGPASAEFADLAVALEKLAEKLLKVIGGGTKVVGLTKKKKEEEEPKKPDVSGLAQIPVPPLPAPTGGEEQ